MALIMQRDLVLALKKETCLNIEILSKMQAMSRDFPLQVSTGNALEKPTQNLFNHITYYLISIIDTQASTSFPWPLYDAQMERAYRNHVSSFVSDYSSKGLLSPVMPSYLVNPGCFKVTLLLFQLSQLAVQKFLRSVMKKDTQRKLYEDMTEKYKSQHSEGFIEQINIQTDIMLSKFSYYLHKRRAMEKIAEKLRKQISKMESTQKSTNAQQFLDNLVDGFIDKQSIDDVTKKELNEIKNVNKSPKLFDSWLCYVDKKIEDMESKWTEKVSPFLELCKNTQYSSETLIARHTGEADKDTYMIEYNHETDEICTKDLQAQVNSQQKYILKNIVKDERLNFPNLIRGFLIAISFILKNTEIGDEIYKFNEYLDGSKSNYRDIVKALRGIVERVMNAETKLQPSPVSYCNSVFMKDYPEIPPLPDLSDLQCSKELQFQALFDSFTPLSMSKHQFNLRRKTNLRYFVKPQPKSLLITPFCRPSKDDFMKSLISCRVSSYDHPEPQNMHNLSIISHYNNRVNETIAECSSGFTKEQILRLVSTKKTSSSKKLKYKTGRPDIHVIKGGLFNESNTSGESNGLYRSYSSPNLYENKERRFTKAGQRKLSIMEENSPTALEVSGITALDKDSGCEASEGFLANCGKLLDTSSLPHITITEPEQKFHNMIKDFEVDLNKEFLINESLSKRKEIEPNTETPKNKEPLIRKTSSLEKIIKRFRKVCSNATETQSKANEFHPIVEEKENINVNLECTANRILLPDLLSPSCSYFSKKSDYSLDFMDMDDKPNRRTRESLGTALGVDHTFLDQFDLVD